MAAIIEDSLYVDGKYVGRASHELNRWTIEYMGPQRPRVIVRHPSEEFENNGDLTVGSLIQSQTEAYGRQQYGKKLQRQAARKERMARLQQRAFTK